MPVWEEEENYDEEEDDCEGPVEMGEENVFKKVLINYHAKCLNFVSVPYQKIFPKMTNQNQKPEADCFENWYRLN